MIELSKKLIFYGCSMDCDERFDAIEEKKSGKWAPGGNNDPFNAVMKLIRQDIPSNLWTEAGSIDIPAWLYPKPEFTEHPNITTEKFIKFIDENGCRQIASDIFRFVSSHVLPEIPCMIGIDHSLTGGAYQALSEKYGKKNLSLIIIDSHTDAIPMDALSGAIQYDIETNPYSVHDPKDRFLYNRSNSYNASSFIHHLLSDQLVEPNNLYIVGVSDYPQKKIFRLKDKRISKYVNIYSRLNRNGVKLLTKQDCLLKPKKLKTLINLISTPFIYISVDMDIGALNALEGVRFRNWKGIGEDQLYRLVDMIIDPLHKRNIQLAGMDIMEIDPRRAGGMLSSGPDRTYAIAANLIKKIAFGK
jgi:arginase family enzyme